MIFVPFAAASPRGAPVDVLTGFLDDDGKAHGRPVGVAIDKHGALLVADDVGNVIWRVTASGPRLALTPLAATAFAGPGGRSPRRLLADVVERRRRL